MPGCGKVASPPPPQLPALCFQCPLMHPGRYATAWHPMTDPGSTLTNRVRLLMHLECLTSCDDFWTLTNFVQLWHNGVYEQAFSLDYYKFVQSSLPCHYLLCSGGAQVASGVPRMYWPSTLGASRRGAQGASRGAQSTRLVSVRCQVNARLLLVRTMSACCQVSVRSVGERGAGWHNHYI